MIPASPKVTAMCVVIGKEKIKNPVKFIIIIE
jgi:hypothetical protein